MRLPDTRRWPSRTNAARGRTRRHRGPKARNADLDLGLADLSIAVLARKLDSRRVLTFDERRFRAVRPLQGGAFTLLPADARGER